MPRRTYSNSRRSSSSSLSGTCPGKARRLLRRRERVMTRLARARSTATSNSSFSACLNSSAPHITAKRASAREGGVEDAGRHFSLDVLLLRYGSPQLCSLLPATPVPVLGHRHALRLHLVAPCAVSSPSPRSQEPVATGVTGLGAIHRLRHHWSAHANTGLCCCLDTPEPGGERAHTSRRVVQPAEPAAGPTTRGGPLRSAGCPGRSRQGTRHSFRNQSGEMPSAARIRSGERSPLIVLTAGTNESSRGGSEKRPMHSPPRRTVTKNMSRLGEATTP